VLTTDFLDKKFGWNILFGSVSALAIVIPNEVDKPLSAFGYFNGTTCCADESCPEVYSFLHLLQDLQ
jgi:hypothetical protein